jgi:hypothetical protein
MACGLKWGVGFWQFKCVEKLASILIRGLAPGQSWIRVTDEGGAQPLPCGDAQRGGASGPSGCLCENSDI